MQDEEWDIFTQQFVRLANEVIQRADNVIATPAVVASEVMKAKKFNDVINDETSMSTTLEVLMAWRSNTNLILIRDDLQLASPVYIVAVENLFFKTLGNSMFARYRDLYMPAFLLNEQMRMPAGMMHLSNDMIYQGKLQDGKGTALDELPEARALNKYICDVYPSTKAEPEELIYPVMLNLHGESQVEANSKSVSNVYNVATTINEVIKLIGTLSHTNSLNVGIAIPYRAQIRRYRRALAKAHKRFPELSLPEMSVTRNRLGTPDYWPGKALPYLCVNLVRASNDAANLGFMSHSRQLNVLITRQTLGLWIVGDEHCILTLGQQADV